MKRRGARLKHNQCSFGKKPQHNGYTHVKKEKVEEPEAERHWECGAEERQEPGGSIDGRVYADRFEVHVQRRQLLLRTGIVKYTAGRDTRN